MSTTGNEPTPASAAAVAGLASEVDGLRRRVDQLAEVPERVQRLGEVIDQLADQVAEFTSRAAPSAIPSWLMLPRERDAAESVLEELVAWLQAVFLRYPDAAAVVPDCWAWHPEVIEELVWLMHAWLAAYQGRGACVALAGDWHDRYRPGVVRRLRASVASCSLEQHTHPHGPVSVPLPDAVEPIAAWWAEHRDQPAPEPTEQQFAAVAPRRRAGGTRR